MSKQTQTLLLLAGAAAVAYFLFIRGKNGGNGSATNAVEIARAEAAAEIARAEAAASIAKSNKANPWGGFLTGIGEGAGTFIGGLAAKL